MLFGHGDDLYNATNEIKINFSSNVWHGAQLEELKEHLFKHFDVIRNYPEPDAAGLKKRLATNAAMKENNLLITNGSVTAFYLLAQAYKGLRSIMFYPAFSEYEDACRLYEHEMSFYPTSSPLTDIPLVNKDLCWICNPNNPDGTIIDRKDLLQVIENNRHTLFIIDQAYAAFTTETLLKPKDIGMHPNLVLIESISKVYDTPGLRIGYIIAQADIIAKIGSFMIPWSINALAVEAGNYISDHPEQFVLPLHAWLDETTRLCESLNEIEGLEVMPTNTTFFLVHLEKGKASGLKKYLLEEYGILIRDASNFRGLNDSYIRLSTQKPSENQLIVKAIREWINQKGCLIG